MAQTGFTPIQLYSSSTPTNAPAAGNLTNDTKGSELAINIADKNLFFKDSTNAVNTVPIRQSGASSNGWLSSTDWNTFNNKVSSQWTTSGSNINYTAGIVSVGTTTTESGYAFFVRGNAFVQNTTGTTIGKTTVDSGDNRLVLGSYFEPGVGQYCFISSTDNAETGNIDLQFRTGTTERARIFASGGVSIGNTTDPGAGNLRLANSKFIRLPTSSTNFDLKGNPGGNDYLSIDANGTQRHLFNDVGAAYNTTGTWGTISDARLKDNIVDATAKLDSLMQLRVVNYNLKTDPDIKQIGFVAQEIEQIFPGLVEQGEPTEDGDFYKSVKTSVLIPILVKAMQEQQTQIDELKNQLTQLKGT